MTVVPASSRTGSGSGSGTGFTTVAAKTADTTRSATVTLTADPHLAFTIGASATEIWFWEAFIIQNSANATMNAKYGLSAPAGATAFWGPHDNGAAIAGWNPLAPGGSPGATNGVASSVALASVNNGTTLISMGGWIFGGGTGGSVALTWAQNTSDAGNLVLKKGSLLRVYQIAA